MPITEQTPLQQALLDHLGHNNEDLVPVCTQAITLGQQGAKDDDFAYFAKKLTLPNGRILSVEDIITFFNLNTFIQWGGGEHEWTI